jgi:hypothetical protein
MSKVMKKILISLTAVLALASCAEDTGLEVYENQLYLTTSEKTRLLYVSTENTYTDVLEASIAKPAEEDVQITYAEDESLVAVYNDIYHDNAVMLPTENYIFSSYEDKINAGDVRSSSVTLEFLDVLSLDKEVRYVLPVTIRKSNMKILDSRKTKYYIFEGANLVNIVADMHDNYCDVEWKNPAVVTGMQEVTMECLANANWSNECGDSMCTLMGIEGYFLMRVGDVGHAKNEFQFCGYPNGIANGPLVEYQKWTHIVLTLSLATGQVNVYFNGVKQPQSTVVNTSKWKNMGGVSFSIDKSVCDYPEFHIGTAYNNTRNLCGYLSECRIWNRVLTAEEIADQKVRPYYVDPKSEGLVAYWKFNEGTGSTIVDRTGNGNDAVAKNPIKWVKMTLPEE